MSQSDLEAVKEVKINFEASVLIAQDLQSEKNFANNQESSLQNIDGIERDLVTEMTDEPRKNVVQLLKSHHVSQCNSDFTQLTMPSVKL